MMQRLISSISPLLQRADFAATDPAPPAGDAFMSALRSSARIVFQPIVAMSTGELVGLEALMRGYECLSFAGVSDLLDYAARQGLLTQVETLLCERAIDGFVQHKTVAGTRLFLNIDNRDAHVIDRAAILNRQLTRLGLSPAAVCIEVSEQHPLPSNPSQLFRPFRDCGFTLALDDYGAGHSGLRRLHELQPDLLKVDRYFIAGLSQDNKRRLLLSTITALARVLGIPVVAEGVETEREYLVCKELGCDYAQGYFICKPTDDAIAIQRGVEHVQRVNRADRRRNDSDDGRFVREHLDQIAPMTDDAAILSVIEFFRRETTRTVVPIVDRQTRPRGIISEATLKQHVYAPYGKDLLANRRAKIQFNQFLSPCPVCDIGTDLDTILEIFALDSRQTGIIITERGRYLGMLDAKALLQALNERNLSFARDQNPLTRLPGNRSIERYLARAVEIDTAPYAVAYFDLDNFKPFNDRFGFRVGDRIIRALGDLLRTRFTDMDSFVGHVGGDDFFLAVREPDYDKLFVVLRKLLDDLRDDARGFYYETERANGYISGRNRDDLPCQIPLLTCSAVVLRLPAGTRSLTIEDLNRRLAAAKSSAKRHPEKLLMIDLADA